MSGMVTTRGGRASPRRRSEAAEESSLVRWLLISTATLFLGVALLLPLLQGSQLVTRLLGSSVPPSATGVT